MGIAVVSNGISLFEVIGLPKKLWLPKCCYRNEFGIKRQCFYNNLVRFDFGLNDFVIAALGIFFDDSAAFINCFRFWRFGNGTYCNGSNFVIAVMHIKRQSHIGCQEEKR